MLDTSTQSQLAELAARPSDIGESECETAGVDFPLASWSRWNAISKLTRDMIDSGENRNSAWRDIG
jgi:hypothetical protein